MSSFRAPTIAAWERDEHEGTYQAEMQGWTLTTFWTPNDGATRGCFYWEASREGANKPQRSGEDFVELAHAMSDAEAFARRTPAS